MDTKKMMLADIYEESDDDGESPIVISETDELKNMRILLIKRISKIIKFNHWNQKYAASLLKIDQPKISQIKNFKTDGFSLERLLKFFLLLGWRVEINLKK